MTSADFNILGSTLRAQLTAIQRTQSAVDTAQLHLATGLEVNSAIENPGNFFSARALNNRASDLQRLLDDIGQNLQVIEAADNALQAIEAVLNQSEALMNELFLDLTTRDPPTLNEVILADNPDAYWRLNETTGNTAVNLGAGGSAIDGTYNANIPLGEGEALYIGEGNDVTPAFPGGAGGNRRVSVPDSTLINIGTHDLRTVELVFNADSDISSRQILYEEGGTTNSLAIYIEDGRIYFTGRDAGAWGPVGSAGGGLKYDPIFTEIEAGETYHAAFVFDFPSGTFTGYLNGEEVGQTAVNATFPQHGANTGIGGLNGGAYFHDGPQNGQGLNFRGRIAEVALYNEALTQEDLQRRVDASFIQKSIDAEDALNELLSQLDLLALDGSYRGTNLLDGDDMETFFNEFRTSSLVSEGGFFSAEGLGINIDPDFNTVEEIESTLVEIRQALESVRNFGTSLANDFSILSTREMFIENMIVDLREGAQKLTIADQNEEGAKLLALQTRQQIQFSVLSFQSNSASIADFLI